MVIRRLLGALVVRTTRMLSEQEGIIFEKQILRPFLSRDEYKKQHHGFTQFDRASSTLGMRKKAFDLKTSLADGDAEKCMEGIQCVSLGIEIEQLRANIEYLWMSDGNKRI